MTTFWQSQLPLVDLSSPDVIDALTFGGQPRNPATYSRPLRFVAMDGKTYWVKHKVQHGLVVELIAGRLAARVGVGPVARIVRVSAAAFPPTDQIPAGVDLAPYVGELVGSEDVPGTENARELDEFIRDGAFAPGTIDAVSRAATIVFQSWIGATDEQVLVRLTDGKVFSIDHGGCFGSINSHDDPTPIVAPIPGVSSDVGRERHLIEATVDRIEAITDADLVRTVDGVPKGTRWQSDPSHRLAIAEWLAQRRDRLRKVMTSWAL